MVLRSPGIASVVIFTTHGSSVLSVVKYDDKDVDISKLAKTIRKEVSEIPVQNNVLKNANERYQIYMGLKEFFFIPFWGSK